MKGFLVVLLTILLQITYQGMVFENFPEQFANFLSWKSQRNQSIGQGTAKLQNFIKFVNQIGHSPQKLKEANLTYSKPEPWSLTNEPTLSTSVGFIAVVNKKTILPKGWRLLTYEQVIPIHNQVMSLMTNDWAIIGLENGRVYGAGYQYKLETKDGSECGQKFIIREDSDN